MKNFGRSEIRCTRIRVAAAFTCEGFGVSHLEGAATVNPDEPALGSTPRMTQVALCY